MGATDIDEFKKEIIELCRQGEEKSCKAESLLKDKTNLVNNVLSSKGFDIKFPDSFKIYHKEVWELVKDEFLSNASTRNNYQLGGWVTKTSFFTGKTSERVYAFIESIPLDEELLSLFKGMKFKEVAQFYKDTLIQDLQTKGKTADVTVKKIKSTYPYYFVVETKSPTTGVKKDLYIFGDNSGIVKVTFSGSNSESKNIDSFIKQTIKGITIKDRSRAVVFDAYRVYRMILYTLAALILIGGIFFVLERKYQLVSKLYFRVRGRQSFQ